jgi:hypothetical protein
MDLGHGIGGSAGRHGNGNGVYGLCGCNHGRHERGPGKVNGTLASEGLHTVVDVPAWTVSSCLRRRQPLAPVRALGPRGVGPEARTLGRGFQGPDLVRVCGTEVRGRRHGLPCCSEDGSRQARRSDARQGRCTHCGLASGFGGQDGQSLNA